MGKRRSFQEPTDKLLFEGVVDETLPGGYYRVMLDLGMSVTCSLSGKMKLHRIDIIPGDKVKVELSDIDPSKGRVVFRSK